MFIIYDLIFLVIALIALPVYLFRRKFHRGFLMRLGFLPSLLALDRPIWIHSVSVGETMAIRGLLEELRKVFPEKKFVISTVTPTGNKIAKTISKEGDFVTYLPLDFSFIVRGVLKRIRPSLFIIAETEIWPNLISQIKACKIPLITVNARISDHSFKGYRTIQFLIKPILNRINCLCVQAERDAQRLISLGVIKEKIHVTGNMKFDQKLGTLSYDIPELGLKENDQFWVCGSTHSGEEEIILSSYKELIEEYPNLKLLIAPRHPERSEAIEKIIQDNGFHALRISGLESGVARQQDNKITVFILDTVGRLLSFYAVSDIVFVGGSLIRKGGHNILEPAALEKPIIFGPEMFNFRDIADLFLNNQAAILVHNEEELASVLKYLLSNPEKRSELTDNAKRLIQENQGATYRNLEYIKKLL